MKRYKKIWAIIIGACLLFLPACHHLDEHTSNTPLITPDGQISPIEESPSWTTEASVFPLTYAYEAGSRFLKSGKLVCTINSVYLINSMDVLINKDGFTSDASVTFRSENGYWNLIYPEFIQDGGGFFPGLYLLMVELTIDSEDAVSYTRKDHDTAGYSLGRYDDSYLFRADSLLYLLDLSPEAVEGQYGYYLLSYYSNMNQRVEHPMVFRLEPGKTINFTVGFLIGDSQQGGGMHFDSLYLSTTQGGYDPQKMLTKLDLHGVEVFQQ